MKMDSFHNENEMSSAGRPPQNEYYTMSRIHCGESHFHFGNENEFPDQQMKTTRNDQVICQWIAKNRASPVGEVILDHGKMIFAQRQWK